LGLPTFLDEEESDGVVIDIRPIKDNGVTLMWCTVVDIRTGEATTRKVDSIKFDINEIRLRLKRGMVV
jgi:hypothetical protein